MFRAKAGFVSFEAELWSERVHIYDSRVSVKSADQEVRQQERPHSARATKLDASAWKPVK
jgi:hypothetical protein